MQRFVDLDNEFLQADRDGDSLLIPPEAKAYFDQFQLPLHIMKFIWASSKSTPAVGLTRDEFKTAMQLIRKELTNPGSLQPQQPPQNFVPPQQAPGFDYSIKQEERDQYETNFSSLARGKYTIPHDDCINFFAKAGLPNEITNAIFQLADFERNNMLDKEEFVIAMHLVRLKRKNPNLPIPLQMPPVLIPPSKQQLIGGSTVPLSSSPINRPRSESTTSFDSVKSGPPSLVPTSGSLGMPPMNTFNQGPNTFGNFGPNTGMMGSPGMMGGPIGGGSSGPLTMGSVRDLENQVGRVLDETRMINQQMFPLRQSVEQNDLRLNSLKERKVDLENDLNQVRQEFENLKMQYQQKSEEISSLEAQIYTFEQERGELQNQIQRIRQEIMRLDGIQEKAQLSAQSSSGVVESLKSELEQHFNELVQMKDELLRLRTSNDQGDEYSQTIENDILNAKNELISVRQQLSEAKQANEELQSKVKGSQIQKQEIEKTAFQTKTELSSLITQNEDLKNQLIKCQQEFEGQKQQGVPNAKLIKLGGFVKKIQEYIHDFDNALQEEFPNQSPLELKKVQPISTTIPVPTKTTTPQTQTAPASFGNDDFGFDNGFGGNNDFGSSDFGFDAPPPVKTTTTQPPVSQAKATAFDDSDFGFDVPQPVKTTSVPPPKTTTPSFGSSSFGDEDDFGFDAPPTKTTSTKTPTTGFDDFGTTKAATGGFDDFGDFGFGNNQPAKTTSSSGFDDFGAAPTQKTASTKTPTGFDDFGFDDKQPAAQTSSNNFGFDEFDNFGTGAAQTTEKTADPWSDFSAGNSVITKEAPKEDNWASFGDEDF